MAEPAVWKLRALARCEAGDVDGALAALILDLRSHDRAAALEARDQLSFALFHRRFGSPADAREFIVSFLSHQGASCACHENTASRTGIARAG